MSRLSLATCNVNGLKNDKKRKAFFTLFRSSNYDIIFLQETHCHLRQEQTKWGMEWDGQSIWSMGSNKSRGVTVLFNRNYNFCFENVIIDMNGRYIVFDLSVADKKYRLINIYAPNVPNERINFFNMIEKYLVMEYESLIAGDFNCTLNPEVDRVNCIGVSDIGNREIGNIIESYDLEDVYRRRFPEKKLFSWCRGTKASRIDYWLISKSLDNQVDNIDYKVCPLSDHGLVELKFRTTETKHGKGIWRMNLNIVTSPLFKKSFQSLWKYWQGQKPQYEDIAIWWDLGKKKIKDLVIRIASEINVRKKQKQANLENFINAVQGGELTEMMKEKVEKAKHELKEMLEQKGDGARVRSRVNWFENGEKSSKFFHNLEKRNAKDKMWESILDANGKMIHGIKNILKTQVDFYSKLYKSEPIQQEKKAMFLDTFETTLTEQEKIDLDRDISKDEIGQSLKKMKNNKSPGPDGILTEFYKLYWEDLGQDLLEVFENSFYTGRLPKSQYLAMIRLLFKKGERENLKNWRPISLLNSDGKILSKLLSERLKKVLPNIISRDQKGCIKGRLIGENIRLITDIIENCEDDEVILLIDQEKAFDRVEFDWLFAVLQKLDFGSKFLLWLKIIYKEMQSFILTNGYLSETFSVSRGIRQGDSLSALLYILQIEPLSAYIRHTNRIKGINIVGWNGFQEVKNKHYVDDTIICLNHANMTDECLDIIDEFGRVSGSKLNREKTVGLVMNEKVIYDNDINSDIRLTLGPVTVLGIPLGKQIQIDYWESLLEVLRKRLSMWKKRNLSLKGKVHIIKSMGISKLLFSTDHMIMTEEHLAKAENILYEFLWGGKKCKMKKEVCTLPRSMGGIGMLDLRVALKVQKIKWVRRVLQANVLDEWTVFPLKNFACLDRMFDTELFALRVNNSSECMNSINIGQFYYLCINYFQELCRKGRVETDQDIIWCNKALKFNGKTLAFPHWAKSGILYKYDIIKNANLNEQGIYDSLKYKASFYFDIAKLKVSIPKEWYKEYDLNNSNANISTEKVKKLILDMPIEVPEGPIKKFVELTSRDMYNVLLMNKNVFIKSKEYWTSKFENTNIDFTHWFNSLFNCSITPRKCIDFNWRIFHGQVNTEKRLAKMKFSDGFCKLCKVEIENLEHLLFDCCKVYEIWQLISPIFEQSFTVQLDKFMVLAGNLKDNNESKIINMMLSICRWLIWKRRNRFKFENDYTDESILCMMIKNEISKHIDTLLMCRHVKKNTEMYMKLHYLKNSLSN